MIISKKDMAHLILAHQEEDEELELVDEVANTTLLADCLMEALETE